MRARFKSRSLAKITSETKPLSKGFTAYRLLQSKDIGSSADVAPNGEKDVPCLKPFILYNQKTKVELRSYFQSFSPARDPKIFKDPERAKETKVRMRELFLLGQASFDVLFINRRGGLARGNLLLTDFSIKITNLDVPGSYILLPYSRAKISIDIDSRSTRLLMIGMQWDGTSRLLVVTKNRRESFTLFYLLRLLYRYRPIHDTDVWGGFDASGAVLDPLEEAELVGKKLRILGRVKFRQMFDAVADLPLRIIFTDRYMKIGKVEYYWEENIFEYRVGKDDILEIRITSRDTGETVLYFLDSADMNDLNVFFSCFVEFQLDADAVVPVSNLDVEEKLVVTISLFHKKTSTFHSIARLEINEEKLCLILRDTVTCLDKSNIMSPPLTLGLDTEGLVNVSYTREDGVTEKMFGTIDDTSLWMELKERYFTLVGSTQSTLSTISGTQECKISFYIVHPKTEKYIGEGDLTFFDDEFVLRTDSDSSSEYRLSVHHLEVSMLTDRSGFVLKTPNGIIHADLKGGRDLKVFLRVRKKYPEIFTGRGGISRVFRQDASNEMDSRYKAVKSLPCTTPWGLFSRRHVKKALRKLDKLRAETDHFAELEKWILNDTSIVSFIMLSRRTWQRDNPVLKALMFVLLNNRGGRHSPLEIISGFFKQDITNDPDVSQTLFSSTGITRWLIKYYFIGQLDVSLYCHHLLEKFVNFSKWENDPENLVNLLYDGIPPSVSTLFRRLLDDYEKTMGVQSDSRFDRMLVKVFIDNLVLYPLDNIWMCATPGKYNSVSRAVAKIKRTIKQYSETLLHYAEAPEEWRIIEKKLLYLFEEIVRDGTNQATSQMYNVSEQVVEVSLAIVYRYMKKKRKQLKSEIMNDYDPDEAMAKYNRISRILRREK